MTTSATCARCDTALAVDDLVVDVRRVTRIYPDATIATDRAELVAHLACPAALGHGTIDA